jgi:oligoribonuclease NrnB/cAMP/cGMP phosphodiesterase (DHH superfamily)
MKTLCIHHGNCADGFGAAWVVRKALGMDHVDFHAATYQDAPPDVTGRDVLMVDFSYKRPVMAEIVAKANSVKVLDHHKTAAADLLPMLEAGEIGGVFDMERSGAGIAWDHFFPGEPRPMLVNHIEDRDLWRFQFPETRAIQANVFSYPYDFEVWDRLFATPTTTLAAGGEAIERKHFKDIAELTKVVTRPMRFQVKSSDDVGKATDSSVYQIVPMANLPYTLTSDAGHLLCGDQYPFAGCYWDTPEGRVFSLRSRENGADVSEIAKLYGGGGHAHASGFRVPFDQLAQFEV